MKRDAPGPRIVAVRVGGDYLIDVGKGKLHPWDDDEIPLGRILHPPPRTIMSPPLPLHGILKFGYWEEAEVSPETERRILACYAEALDRERFYERILMRIEDVEITEPPDRPPPEPPPFLGKVFLDHSNEAADWPKKRGRRAGS